MLYGVLCTGLTCALVRWRGKHRAKRVMELGLRGGGGWVGNRANWRGHPHAVSGSSPSLHRGDFLAAPLAFGRDCRCHNLFFNPMRQPPDIDIGHVFKAIVTSPRPARSGSNGICGASLPVGLAVGILSLAAMVRKLRRR